MLEIPLAWYLAEHTTLRTNGVFVAIAFAFSTVAVVSAILFRQGGWKTKTV